MICYVMLYSLLFVLICACVAILDRKLVVEFVCAVMCDVVWLVFCAVVLERVFFACLDAFCLWCIV